MSLLTSRWTTLKYHPVQNELWNSTSRFCVVPAGRRSGKCLAKDSRIYLANGTIKLIQDVKVGDIVWSINKNYELEPKKVKHVFSNGVKEVVRISTNKNRVFCTLNHPFLVNDSWVEAKDIKVNDLISSIKEFKNFYNEDDIEEEIDDIDLDFLAFWIAEGSKTKIATISEEMLEIVNDFCDKYDLSLRKSKADNCSYNIKCDERNGGKSIIHPTRLFLEKYNLYDKISKTKFIPDFIYNLNKERIARFLSVFIGCDGCVRNDGRQVSLSIGLANEHLIIQLSELFLKFGIKGRIRKKIHSKKSKITGENFVNWEYRVTEKDSFNIFYEEIGAVGKEENCIECFNLNLSNSGTCNDYLPVSYDKFIKHLEYDKNTDKIANNSFFKGAPPELSRLLNNWRKRNTCRITTKNFNNLKKYCDSSFDNLVYNDVRYDEVKDIKLVGEQETFDLTVEDNHNFIVNGFVTHNTELAKRKLVTKALRGPTGEFYDMNLFAGAPTRDQAKRIYWEDLKAMIHPKMLLKKPSESDLTIKLINNVSVSVVGLDVPERIEGSPWDWGILDEYGNMKEQAWDANIRPAFADRRGGCWLIGVPEGRNHYYKLYKSALEDTTGEWSSFHWFSSDILPADEIESARKRMDALTFQQEYEGSFISFQGRAYYSFDTEIHCGKLQYDPKKDLILCFDFNVSPGICAIIQEQTLHYRFNGKRFRNSGSGIISEVYIEKDSNTVKVCKEILEQFGNHEGNVYCYGDSSGGSKGSAKISGSDWDLVKQELNPYFPGRIQYRYPKKNPAERARVNAMNSRLLSTANIVRLMVDKEKAPFIIEDLDGVELKDDGSGEIDKKKNPKLTHLSDAIGYYINREFPVNEVTTGNIKIVGI